MPIQLTKRTVIAAFLALAAIALIVAVSLRGTSGLFGTGLAQTTAPQTQASQTPVSTAQAPLNPVGGQRDGPPVTPKPSNARREPSGSASLARPARDKTPANPSRNNNRSMSISKERILA